MKEQIDFLKSKINHHLDTKLSIDNIWKQV